MQKSFPQGKAFFLRRKPCKNPPKILLIAFMEAHSISFQFQGRYFKLGNISPKTRQVWFVLHGYAQLAEFFVKKFSQLLEQEICVIAPEGLSRFYQQGFTGRVGATWMTKESRRTDIQNYLTYLDRVYDQEINNIDPPPPVAVLGFSQGAETASRWVVHGNVQFQHLILWAGVFPPDLDVEKSKQTLHGKDIHFIYGDRDPFVNDDRLALQTEQANRLNVNPRIHTFHGFHNIDLEMLRKICDDIL